MLLAALPLRVVVGRLLTARYLTALLPKGTAGGTAGSVMASSHMEQLLTRLHVARLPQDQCLPRALLPMARVAGPPSARGT